jgi:hypothetical protein
MKREKTIVIPDADEPAKKPPPREPFVVFAGGDSDERDVSKPIAYDEHGNPLYAPRGMTFRVPR